MNLHPKMASWLLNELENGRFSPEDEDDERILEATLTALRDPGPPALQPGQFEVRVGKDARMFFTAVVTGHSLDELKGRLGRHGWNDDGLTITDWVQEDAVDFDAAETVEIHDHDGIEVWEESI